MADEQSGSLLRRWRPFYGAFGAIDDAIESASGGGHPRAAHQDVRVRILLLLRAATDDGVAEQLCAALDDAMEESLKTLLLVAPVPRSSPASADLARTVGALANHNSARIRGLASDVVRRCRYAVPAAVEAHRKLQIPPPAKKLHIPPPPAKMLPTTSATMSGRQKTSEIKKFVNAQSEKMEAKKPIVTQRKKMEATKPIVAQSKKTEATKPVVVAQSEKMEATKRKLREGYEEAEKIKRQRVIQKIDDKDASRMFEQSQRKMQRAPARCRLSAGGVRRSLLPSLQLI